MIFFALGMTVVWLIITHSKDPWQYRFIGYEILAVLLWLNHICEDIDYNFNWNELWLLYIDSMNRIGYIYHNVIWVRHILLQAIASLLSNKYNRSNNRFYINFESFDYVCIQSIEIIILINNLEIEIRNGIQIGAAHIIFNFPIIYSKIKIYTQYKILTCSID